MVEFINKNYIDLPNPNYNCTVEYKSINEHLKL